MLLQAFILAILCLVFNERLIYRLDKEPLHTTYLAILIEKMNACCQDRQEFYFCEHYAGEGVMTREVGAVHGPGAARLDLKYHPSMNICTPAGFAIQPQSVVVYLDTSNTV